MLEIVDKKDKEMQDALDKIKEANEKVSVFNKLLKYNKPAILIFTGVICSMFDGMLMPLTGLILSELLTYMTAAWDRLAMLAQMENFDV